MPPVSFAEAIEHHRLISRLPSSLDHGTHPGTIDTKLVCIIQVKVGSKLPDVELILPSAEAPTSDSFVTTLDLFQGASSSAQLALSNLSTSSVSLRKAAESCACSAATAELWCVVDSEQLLAL